MVTSKDKLDRFPTKEIAWLVYGLDAAMLRSTRDFFESANCVQKGDLSAQHHSEGVALSRHDFLRPWSARTRCGGRLLSFGKGSKLVVRTC